tara:strand:+ start:5304 stop:5546 length:243 start_codon:yes stop_codon:yes gene_type:complete
LLLVHNIYGKYNFIISLEEATSRPTSKLKNILKLKNFISASICGVYVFWPLFLYITGKLTEFLIKYEFGSTVLQYEPNLN